MKRNGNKKLFWKKSFRINKKKGKKQFGRMIWFKIAQKQESRSNKIISTEITETTERPYPITIWYDEGIPRNIPHSDFSVITVISV